MMIEGLINFLKSDGFIQVEGEFSNIGKDQFQVIPKNYNVEMNLVGGMIGVYDYEITLYFNNKNYKTFINNFEYIKEIINYCQNFNEYAGIEDINYSMIDHYNASKLNFILKVFQNISRS